MNNTTLGNFDFVDNIIAFPFELFFACTSSVSFACLPFLLPIFCYVLRVNKEKDEKALIYPFLNHLCGMAKKMCFLIYPAFAWLILLALTTDPVNHSPRNKQAGQEFVINHFAIVPLILLFLDVIIIFSCVIMSKIFNILLIFSAIFRFSLYFFPSTEGFISSLQKKFISRIYLVYGVCFLKEAVFIVLRFERVITNDEKFIKTIDFVSTIDYTIMNSILFFSGFLYAPIVISLEKYKHLPSARQNNPQKYIMYQTMIMVIYRICTTILIVIEIAFDRKYKTIWFLFFVIDITDVFITPFIIQVSYLSCNKRNVDVLFSIFTDRLRKFFGRFFGKKVHPGSDIEVKGQQEQTISKTVDVQKLQTTSTVRN